MNFIDLKAQYEKLKVEIDNNIKKVLSEAHYISGRQVEELEIQLKKYVNTKYCLTCGNGTDALSISLMALDIKKGDAVFVPAFTFYATAEVVSLIGATPIFIDCDEDTFNIDVKKLEKAIEQIKEEGKLIPKAIIPVDLFGQPAEFEKIRKIAIKYNLYLIEDGAQGFGGEINGKKACSFGDISTTSFFPAKPLGCYGDGGAIFTNNEEFYRKMLSIKVHGKGEFKYDNVRVGLNSRLDTIQAGILIPKLKAFEEYELNNRNLIAKQYSENLKKYVKTPIVLDGYLSSWAQYTIQLESKEERDYLQSKLKDKEIPTNIYYPKPLHKQKVYKYYKFNLEDLKVSEKLSEMSLSLPMHPYLEKKDINKIINSIIEILEEYRNGK